MSDQQALFEMPLTHQDLDDAFDRLRRYTCRVNIVQTVALTVVFALLIHFGR